MIPIFLLSIVSCKKNDFVIRPADSKHEILRIHGNYTLRVDSEPPSLENWPLLLVEISDLGNDYKSLKIVKNYICAPENGNILTTTTKFDEQRCSWKIEENHDGTASMKIGKNYLVRTDEMDNRIRSHGYKMRILPSSAAGDFKWELKKAKRVFGPIDEDEEDDKNDLKEIPADEHKKPEEKNKEKVVVGVSIPTKMPVKK